MTDPNSRRIHQVDSPGKRAILPGKSKRPTPGRRFEMFPGSAVQHGNIYTASVRKIWHLCNIYTKMIVEKLA